MTAHATPECDTASDENQLLHGEFELKTSQHAAVATSETCTWLFVHSVQVAKHILRELVLGSAEGISKEKRMADGPIYPLVYSE